MLLAVEPHVRRRRVGRVDGRGVVCRPADHGEYAATTHHKVLAAGGDTREPQRVLDLVADLRTLPDGAPGQCDWLEAQARWQVGERDRAIELLAGVRELVDPMGLRQTMDRVLLARLLYCGAEQRVAEALTAGVELLCGHPPQAWYVSAVLQVAQGRPDELAHALAAGSGPHLDASLALLAAEPGGAEVADRVRRLRAAALVAAP